MFDIPWSKIAGPCPADPHKTAEDYLLHHLSPTECAAYEDHYLGCGLCAGLLMALEQYIRAMNEAAEQLKRDSQE